MAAKLQSAGKTAPKTKKVYRTSLSGLKKFHKKKETVSLKPEKAKTEISEITNFSGQLTGI